MKPFYKDNHSTIYNIDFRENELPDESVQCVVTSPPYWGLRKYSGEQELIWGGDKNCEHRWIDYNARTYQKGQGMEELAKVWKTGGKPKAGSSELADGSIHKLGLCSVCGAWKGAYGLEPTPEMYVQHTIEILREIRRVLRKDGVVWWNIGDSYSGSPAGNKSTTTGEAAKMFAKGGRYRLDNYNQGSKLNYGTIKPKDLCLIPFRVAIAAQADGWWVRSVIIWSKPNPMPESVTDRPTESHEYILMLTKSKKYYWDADAVREANADPQRTTFVSGARTHGLNLDRNDNDLGERSKDFIANGRNIRSVWSFPTQPYPEAHFAVFPEKLPEICIKAGSPEVGCCSKCGAPWERVIKQQKPEGNGELRYNSKFSEDATGLTPQGFHRTASIENERSASRQEAIEKFPNDPAAQQRYINQIHDHGGIRRTETLGWQATCKCNADKVPSLVLDPFMGAGTTLWVAKKLNRKAVGFEVSEEYCQLTVDRCRQQVMI